MAAHPPAVQPPTPTMVYIDGFNLYYGELKGTPYKWLDLQRFFAHLMGPRHEITRIKYFTARVIPTPADPQINNRQDAYFQALEAFCPSVEIYLGHFLRHAVSARNVNPPPDTVKVWKTEEKGSDVNLAVHVLNDAWLNAYQCAVIVSNDSDLAASLQMVKQRGKLIALVTPGAPKRATSHQLRVHADLPKPIRKWMLQQSQLPDLLPGTGIRKPAGW